jgi:DNA-binding MarR family transcriptional regulator
MTLDNTRSASLLEVSRVLDGVEARLAGLRHAHRACVAPASDQTMLDYAKRLYRERRQREEAFAPFDLFGEPAWDLLLDLFIAGEERRAISVSSACIAAVVPPTTALRWIAALHERGLITRDADPDDRRRCLLALTPHAHRLMLDALRSR